MDKVKPDKNQCTRTDIDTDTDNEDAWTMTISELVFGLAHYLFQETIFIGVSDSVGLFESFGTLLSFVQNRKSMQTLSFVQFKFRFQNKDQFGFV